MNAKRIPPTKTHAEMVSDWMEQSEFKAEYEKLDGEFAFKSPMSGLNGAHRCKSFGLNGSCRCSPPIRGHRKRYALATFSG